MLSRRKFLRHTLPGLPLLLAAPSLLSTSAKLLMAAEAPTSLNTTCFARGLWLLSASDNPSGQHFITATSMVSDEFFAFPVAQRAHDSCISRCGHVLFSARRPGTESYLLEFSSEKPALRSFYAKADRHFYGHGCFSADGQLLYMTENDFRNDRGLVGVYRVSTLEKEAEFETAGIGPHQLKWLPDGKTLVVANGGILTRPASGRKKLNLDSLQSSLVYLDASTGKIKQQVVCERRGMSLRHLDVSRDGKVFVSTQYQLQEESEKPELFFWHQPGQSGLGQFDAEAWQWSLHHGYIASVAVNDSADKVMLTSPRGNLASLWDIHTKKLITTLDITDVAGVVYNSDSAAFVLSSGMGKMYSYQPDSHKMSVLTTMNDFLWDNHLSIARFS
ncbi:MAG: DUF1513 domain-containing protein [Pseudomonadales bacterium]|nr:DUF1513 domain-containing protein [Pseudomonadales bacterium]